MLSDTRLAIVRNRGCSPPPRRVNFAEEAEVMRSILLLNVLMPEIVDLS